MDRNFVLQQKDPKDAAAVVDDGPPTEDDVKRLLTHQIKGSSKRLESIRTGPPLRLVRKEMEKVVTIRIRLNFIQYGYQLLLSMRTDEQICSLFTLIKEDIFSLVPLPSFQIHKAPPKPVQLQNSSDTAAIGDVLGRNDLTVVVMFNVAKENFHPRQSFIRLGLL